MESLRAGFRKSCFFEDRVSNYSKAGVGGNGATDKEFDLDAEF
jgi:hypothetical protein